jgi:hypothetical protein
MLFEFDEEFEVETQRRKPSKPSIFLLIAALVIGGAFLRTTLAANITLNSSGPVEFGQGVALTAACSGSNVLTVTPSSQFVNVSGAGAHYFNSVTVSGVPTSCYGVDFNISVYDSTTSTPLAIFNGTSTSAVVYDNAGSFVNGYGSTGTSIASNSGSFTVTFTSPVAFAKLVSKITIQSLAHTPIPCADGGDCVIGQVGPGGGNIFYVAAGGFNCGPAYTSTGSPVGGQCHYLEVAPNTWAAGTTDIQKNLLNDANTATDVSGITNESSVNLTTSGIGLGYKNSLALVAVVSGTSTAAGTARAYTGGSKSDWYLPTSAELNQMCRWAKGLSTSDFTVCPSGTINGAPAQGFIGDQYWSSSEFNTNLFWTLHMGFAGHDPRNKDSSHPYYMRPIRAF